MENVKKSVHETAKRFHEMHPVRPIDRAYVSRFIRKIFLEILSLKDRETESQK